MLIHFLRPSRFFDGSCLVYGPYEEMAQTDYNVSLARVKSDLLVRKFVYIC